MSSNLTKEQKIERLALIQEKKRRLRRTKSTYTPNAGQQGVHKDEHTIRMVASGNGAGKTCMGGQEAYWSATGWNPVLEKKTRVPSTVVVVLDSPAKIADVWLPELRKWYNIDDECVLHKHGKPYYSEIEFKNGSRILFMMHLQEELAFEGIQIDFAIFDEPPPRHCFIGLARGARKKGSIPKFLFIGTPIAQPWLYEELWQTAVKKERTDIGIHRFSTRVNAANLSDGYIEQFTRNLTDKERQVRLEGEFAHLEGLALAHMFRRDLHVVAPFDWPRGKPVVIAIDPHPAKAHCAMMVGATGDGRVYVIKELSSKATPRAFAAELRKWYQGYRVLDIIIDSLGATPMSGGDGNRSFSEVMRACGVPVRSTAFKDKSDEDFITRIRDVLEIPQEPDNFGRTVPKLGVFEDCYGIISDVETCSWVKYRNLDEYKPKIDISNKDWLACLKYALACNIDYFSQRGRAPRVKRPTNRSPWFGSER